MRAQVGKPKLLPLPESLDRLLWQVAGILLHDLGTPLHVVLFCMDQPLSEERAREQVQRSARRAAESFERVRRYVRLIRQEEASADVEDCLRFGRLLMECRVPESERKHVRVVEENLTPATVAVRPRELIAGLGLLLADAVTAGASELRLRIETGDPVRVLVGSDGERRPARTEKIWMDAALKRWRAEFEAGGALYSLLLPGVKRT